MLSIINHASQWLRRWRRNSLQPTALIQKIVDRLRHSLEVKVVLQTAVDEVAVQLNLDRCSFFWYCQETQRVKVVGDWLKTEIPSSHCQASLLGDYALESFGSLAKAIAAGELIVNQGFTKSSQKFFSYSVNLLIPVREKGGWIGFIVCLSEQPRSWTKEIKFLETLVPSLEIALRQAKLYEQTQSIATREQLVNQITSQTRSSFDLEEILSSAIAQLLAVLEVDRCLIHLVESHLLEETVRESPRPDPRRQHLYAVSRPPFSLSMTEFDPHGPMTQWVIQHRQRVVIADITQDKRIGDANEEYQKAQIKSSLVVPVQANGTIYAILYLNQCSRIRYWSSDDQKLSVAIADQLAISIQQAYLYAKTQQQALHSAAQAQQLSATLKELQLTQAQLIQSENISSLGRMVAGVAHEINNPVSFIYGNIPYLESYVLSLIRLLKAYQTSSEPSREVQTLTEEIDLDFLLRDLPQILQSMQSGAERIREIVQSLQHFSHQNQASVKAIDLHAALESTLLLLESQLSGKIQVVRNYGSLPKAECYPQPIHQVFLHLLTNAIEALHRSSRENKTITLTTFYQERGGVPILKIAIADTGSGINPEIISRIFDPFFTTKDVGQGRGLGLTLSYQTIVQHHQGKLTVSSHPGQGSEFTIEIPASQTFPVAASPQYGVVEALAPV